MIADYFKEMQGYSLLEIPDKGFIMWQKHGDDELHLAHMYVKPEYRRTGLAQELTDKATALGKELGCKYASCVVSLPDKTPEKASRLVRIYIEYGFYIALIVENSQIVLKKDLQ